MKLQVECGLKKNSARLKNNTFLTVLRKDWSAWVLMLPFLLCLYICLWRPTIIGGALSLFKLQGYTPVEFVGFKNYIAVMKDTMFLTTLLNTLQYVFWSFVLGYLPPLIIAIILNEMFLAKGFMRFAVYLPSIVPTIAVSVIWYLLYLPTPDGLLNALLAKCGMPLFSWLENKNMTIILIVISMTWKGFGATCIMYVASLQSINHELYDVGRIEGACIWRRITSVLLPHLKGIMMLFAVQQVIGVMQVMEQPMTMTGGGPDNASLTLALQSYNYGFSYFQADRALALGMIMFVIMLILTAYYF
ncbi:MAG: sugar ABC transporter permease, partial [Oscillospiraceae bacterium]